MWKAVAAISVGGSLGALLRWWLGLLLNSYFPPIPPGTLAANLLGAYVVGVAVAFFAAYAAIAPSGDCSSSPGFAAGSRPSPPSPRSW